MLNLGRRRGPLDVPIEPHHCRARARPRGLPTRATRPSARLACCARMDAAGATGRLWSASSPPRQGTEWLERSWSPSRSGLEWTGVRPHPAGSPGTRAAALPQRRHEVRRPRTRTAGGRARRATCTPSPGSYPARRWPARSRRAVARRLPRRAGAGVRAGRHCLTPPAARARADALLAPPGRGAARTVFERRAAGPRRRVARSPSWISSRIRPDGRRSRTGARRARPAPADRSCPRRPATDSIAAARPSGVARRHEHARPASSTISGTPPTRRRHDRQAARHRLEQHDRQVSKRLGSTNRSAARMRSATAAGLRRPRKRTASPSPSRRAWRAARGSSSPSPMMSSAARPARAAATARRAGPRGASSRRATATLSSRSGSPAARARGPRVEHRRCRRRSGRRGSDRAARPPELAEQVLADRAHEVGVAEAVPGQRAGRGRARGRAGRR